MQSYVNREELTADQIIGLVGALTSIVQATFSRYVRDYPMPPEEGAI
jgi:hypothetical protein